MLRMRLIEKTRTEIDTSDTFEFEPTGVTVTVTPAEDEIQPPTLAPDDGAAGDDTMIYETSLTGETVPLDGLEPEGIIAILIA